MVDICILPAVLRNCNKFESTKPAWVISLLAAGIWAGLLEVLCRAYTQAGQYPCYSPVSERWTIIVTDYYDAFMWLYKSTNKQILNTCNVNKGSIWKVDTHTSLLARPSLHLFTPEHVAVCLRCLLAYTIQATLCIVLFRNFQSLWVQNYFCRY